MSYDLMVFDPAAPPRDRAGFMAWFRAQTRWEEAHGYDDPKISTPALRAWFLEMIERYPAMSGPHASDDPDDPKVTDYSVGHQVIYAAFAWSESAGAAETVLALAEKHGVGLFDVSAEDGEVWIPGAAGYERIHGTGSTIAGRTSGVGGHGDGDGNGNSGGNGDGTGTGLRVFYTCYESGETVEGSAPIAAGHGDLVAIARRVLRGDGDFLGLVDEQEGTLQLMREADGRVWLEIPVPAENGSYGKHVEIAEVETLLDALAVPFDRANLPGLRFERW